MFASSEEDSTATTGTSSDDAAGSSDDAQCINTSAGLIRTNESFLNGAQPFYMRRAEAPSLLVPPPPAVGYPAAYSRPTGFYRSILSSTDLTSLPPLRIDSELDDAAMITVDNDNDDKTNDENAASGTVDNEFSM